MSEKSIVEFCSPTLAGLKTGSLFSIKPSHKENINQELRTLNKILTRHGLRAIPVKRSAGLVLIYIYRPAFLARDLKNPIAAEILNAKGYPCPDADACLMKLIRRLNEEADFPHEIGLFLGYPPSDVAAFMADSERGVKCVGCWKAYGNEREARKTFLKFKQCTDNYRRALQKGNSLEKLIVSV